jgi:hypothetical protein
MCSEVECDDCWPLSYCWAIILLLGPKGLRAAAHGSRVVALTFPRPAGRHRCPAVQAAGCISFFLSFLLFLFLFFIFIFVFYVLLFLFFMFLLFYFFHLSLFSYISLSSLFLMFFYVFIFFLLCFYFTLINYFLC